MSEQNTNTHEKHPHWKRIAGYVILGIAAIAALGAVVMFLWNMIIVPVFNAPQLTYWQATGLLLLAKILFGGKHGYKHRHKPHLSKEEFMNMSEEERCRMRNEWERRCGKKQD